MSLHDDPVTLKAQHSSFSSFKLYINWHSGDDFKRVFHSASSEALNAVISAQMMIILPIKDQKKKTNITQQNK